MRTRQGSLAALVSALALVLFGSQSAIAAPVRALTTPTTQGASAQSVIELPAAHVLRLRAVASRRRVGHAAKAPAITTQPHSVYAAPGSYARFVAAASGYPDPSAQWQVSANHGARWRNIRGVRGRSFAFMAVIEQNGDEFRAVFKNKRGRAATAPALLTVIAGYRAPLIESEPSDLTVGAGANATFTAAAYGDPAPTVQWQLSDNDGVSWSDVAGATQPTLTFLASSILNGDEFRAVFTNVLGTALTSTAMLTVSGPVDGAPQITEQPEGNDVGPGTTVSYTAAASGSPAPSVQWQVSTDSGQSWSDVPGATATTYSFVATSGENLNEYQAVFTNAAGTAATDPAILGVGYLLTSNWSGYAAVGAAGTTYSAVTGSWTVPSVNCTSAPNGSSSQWVGIDGALSDTVEQDGTYADCDGTTPSYGAWYEMLGDAAVSGGAQVNIPRTVQEGDSMTATVSVSADEWTLTVSDDTPSDGDVWSYAPSPIYWAVPAQSSAEWIVERPELCNESSGTCSLTSLADFGTVTFTGATATAGSGPQSIAALSGLPVQMVRSDTDTTLLATPSVLGNTDETFSDSWQASS